MHIVQYHLVVASVCLSVQGDLRKARLPHWFWTAAARAQSVHWHRCPYPNSHRLPEGSTPPASWPPRCVRNLPCKSLQRLRSCKPHLAYTCPDQIRFSCRLQQQEAPGGCAVCTTSGVYVVRITADGQSVMLHSLLRPETAREGCLPYASWRTPSSAPAGQTHGSRP